MRNTTILLPKLLLCRNEILFSQVNSALLTSGKKNNKPSAIQRCVELYQQLSIISKPRLIPTPAFPPNNKPDEFLLTDLSNLPKESTSSEVYLHHFNLTLAQLESDWETIYTDGSKTDTNTTFAVTNQLGVTIAVGSLPIYCSVFTAEAAALLVAVKYASQKRRKFIICSDSKSTLDAIKNQRNETPLVTTIRNILLLNKNIIRIMWVPGHSRIPGNVYADNRAKEAGHEPLHFSDVITNKDIRKLVQEHLHKFYASNWNTFQHPYKKYNPTGAKPLYPSNIACQTLKKFTRLRIGHSISTHAHLLNGSPKPLCPHCNSIDYSTLHTLDYCQKWEECRNAMFPNCKPTDLLRNTDINSITLICKFISQTRLSI